MATYPSFIVDPEQSSQDPVDDLKVDQWPDGTVRGQAFFTPGRYQWTLVHTVSDTDRATIKSFYDSNRLANNIDFVSPWDGVTYHNIIFTALPTYKRIKAGSNYTVTVKLRQAS